MDTLNSLNNDEVEGAAYLNVADEAAEIVPIENLHVISSTGKDAVWLFDSSRQGRSPKYLVSALTS